VTAQIPLDLLPEMLCDAAFCGLSMGGRVAQEIYRIAPDRIIGMGLFGTDYRGPSSDAEREQDLNILLEARHSPDVIRAQARAGASRPDYGDLLAPIRCPTLICAAAMRDWLARIQAGQ
jgi:pimeloyl-ACP methyl ester carboxylesterase